MIGRLVRLAALSIFFALAASTAGQATDVGPGRGVREVRSAVPILLRSRIHDLRNGESTSVDDAIVAGDNAIVDWRTKNIRGISVLTYRNAHWWMTGSAFEWPTGRGWSWWMSDTSAAEYGCPGSSESRTAPDATFLQTVLHADPSVAALWSKNVAPIANGFPEERVRPREPVVARACPVGHPIDQWTFGSMDQTGTIETSTYAYGRLDLLNIDGYRPDWSGPQGWSKGLVRGISRAPTDAEMSVPGADAVFFFSTTVGTEPVAIPKTRLDVWCPFVLDPDARYSLAITGDTIVGPLDGTMANNVLHFEIPAFSAKAGTYLQGEVDWLRKSPD